MVQDHQAATATEGGRAFDCHKQKPI